MKKIFNQLKTIFQDQQTVASVTCNYENNYYGDQVCTINKG